MSKKCKIDSCNNCPYMDNKYYDYARLCTLLDKVLDSKTCDIYCEVYEGCPLKNWDEDEEEYDPIATTK